MKNLRYPVLLSGIFLLIQSVALYAGNIEILGVSKNIDTLEHKSVGPGIQYTKFVLPQYPLSGYMLTIDLNNPYNHVETFQALNQVGKTESMTSAFSRLSNDQHRTIAGINGNFWIVSGQGQPGSLLGVPHSGSACNGEMITDPNNWNRGHGSIGFAMIDSAGKAWIDDISFSGTVKIPGNSEFPLSEINRIRNENELVLFNQYLGSQATRTDDDGTEVFIRPLSGKKWEVNRDVECEVTRVLVNKGSNILQAGETVLSGNGSARTFLEKLNTGDKLFVNMSVKTLTDNQFPSVAQMVTGNALVMKDGTLTSRNYNEAYNTQLYPRTGIGSSHDGKNLYFIVIDKGPKSAGASTETMCGILKACGARNVTSMDGGGSAQMMLDGQIVNNPSDGKERPVANGWFLFHNTPEDSTITRIEFADYQIRIPSYSAYVPVVLGYNRYGVLVDKNVTGFSMSCTPNIGSVTSGHYFQAAGNPATGVLTLSLNGVETSKQVEIISGKISLKCDSVIIDARNDYAVEVLSVSNDIPMAIQPEFLTWEVKDPEICAVDKGILKGLKNGSTFVTGSLAQFRDTLFVQVENPLSAVMIADSILTGDWTLSASSFLNAKWNTDNLPQNWETGAVVNFVHAAGRAPFIKLSNKRTFYGLPDTVKLVLNTGDMAISRAIVSLKPNNTTTTTSMEFNTFELNKDFTLNIPVDKLFDIKDRAIYPVGFDNVNFYIDATNMRATKSYSLALKEIALAYRDFIISYSSPEKLNMFQVYPNPAKENSQLTVRISDKLKNTGIGIRIYNLKGQLVFSENYGVPRYNEVNIPVKYTPGTYFLELISEKGNETAKVFVR